MVDSFQKQFKFSGRIAPQDPYHQITVAATAGAPPDEHYIAPTTIVVGILVPPLTPPIGVPQYGPTVSGGSVGGYNPSGDCGGAFTSSQFQPNNNCYAYGSNIATNTFPQPGRRSGYLLTSQNFGLPFDDLGSLVAQYAGYDGLVFVGTTMAQVIQFQQSKPSGQLGGHFVALMVSPAGDANWPGDYHWARCDDSTGSCVSWSQKDGNDQMTNFDFAGNPITDPSQANWAVNQGPVSSSNTNDQIVDYGFYCFMFVPDTGVNII